jgi:hypothetical protein
LLDEKIHGQPDDMSSDRRWVVVGVFVEIRRRPQNRMSSGLPSSLAAWIMGAPGAVPPSSVGFDNIPSPSSL